MYNYYEKLQPEEILVYMRKSRSDDPTMSVEDVLAKHWSILSDWLARNVDGSIPDENIYREIVSGETLDGRPEVLKLLKRVEDPRIKAILVVEVQRLSRGDLEDCGRLIKLLRYTNTKVITPQKIYDIEDEYDRDAFERELKRGNEYLEYFKKIQNRGRLQSVAAGNYIGSIPPYGFDKTFVMDGKRKCPTLTLNDDSKVVVMIFDLFTKKNTGPVSIAHRLDMMGIKAPRGSHWTHQTVRDILRNPHYNGKVVWYRKKTIKTVEDMEVHVSRPRNNDYLCYDGKQPKLIPDGVFQEAQEILNAHATRENRNKGLRNILSGILYCECGRSMNMRNILQPDGSKYSSARFQCPDQAYCNNGSVLADDLLRIIYTAICEELNRYEIKANENTTQKELSKENTISLLAKQLEALEKKRISLWDKYTDESMPRDVFETLKDKCEKDIAESKKALDEAYRTDTSRVNLDATTFSFKQAATCIYDDTLSPEEKNRLLKAAIKKITYSRPRPVRNKGKNLKGVHGGWTCADPQITIEFNV